MNIRIDGFIGLFLPNYFDEFLLGVLQPQGSSGSVLLINHENCGQQPDSRKNMGIVFRLFISSSI
jgi:hypothetical protein